MPNHAELPPDLAAAIPDELAGDVYPPKPNPAQAAVDGRTIALELLFEYLAALRITRAGDKGGPSIAVPFTTDSMFTEWPDGVQELQFPSIVALDQQRGQFLANGLVPNTVEDTLDVYGRGTVVRRLDEYVEQVQLEVWASTRGERRGICSALDVALHPAEGYAGLRLRMKRYFNSTVHFLPIDRNLSGDQGNARGRRTAIYTVEMRFVTGMLVNAVTLRPSTLLTVT